MNKQEDKILKAIDACRTGSDDLSMPELFELAERIGQDANTQALFDQAQRLDALIGDAFDDVPIPAELAARLSASLAVMPTSSEPQLNGHSLAATPDQDEQEVASRPVQQAGSKHFRTLPLKWLAIVTSLAACLIVAAVGAWTIGTSPEIAVDDFANEVRQWNNALQQNPWNLDLTARLPSQYSSNPLILAAPRGWQQLDEVDFGSKAIAFDLRANEGSPFAALVVLDTNCHFERVNSVLSQRPLSTTGNVCIGAYKVGDTLYVLIIDGSENRYRKFFKPQLPPV